MCLKASFLESLMKEYKWNTFDYVLSLARNTKYKSASFPISTWELGHFFVFFHFSNFGLQYPQKHSNKSLRFIRENKIEPLKFHSNTLNQTAEAMIWNQFFYVFLNAAFWNSMRISCKASWVNLDFALDDKCFSPLKSKWAHNDWHIPIQSGFYEPLKIDNFCPQVCKTENMLKPGPDSSLVFQIFKIKKLIQTTI